LILGGCFTIDDLRKLPPDQFTNTQLIGLKHFEDLETKIPSEEMDVWNVFPFYSTLIQTTILAALNIIDEESEAVLVGS
jgi:Fingers domain of DNA polymerase lambda